jgi:hypothetical protein
MLDPLLGRVCLLMLANAKTLSELGLLTPHIMPTLLVEIIQCENMDCSRVE